jgi:hypothetical protein
MSLGQAAGMQLLRLAFLKPILTHRLVTSKLLPICDAVHILHGPPARLILCK